MAVLDQRAIGLGAVVAIAVALPAALVAQVVVDDAESPWSLLFFAVVLVGFGLGGYAAARAVPQAPFTNGALAAIVAYALVQGIGAVRLIIEDDPPEIVTIAFAALMAFSSGLVGALLAARQQ